MTTLNRTIDKLYEAFANIPRPDTIDGCPCCIHEKNIGTLLSTPLREICSETLARYASSAFLTVGDVSDYLYFLPRILEISATDDTWWPDIEVTGRAISYTDPDSWPQHRFQALVDFLESLIDLIIASEDSHTLDGCFKLDSWLCAIARMNIDVEQFLKRVEQVPSAVIGYFERNAPCLARNKLCNAFWKLPNDGHDTIVQWFKGDAVRQILYDTYGYVG